MGRQTSVAMSEADEQLFLHFLRQGADIQIMRRSPRHPDELVIQNFPPRGAGEHTYWIWNTAFPYKPVLEPWPGRHSPDAPIQNFQLVETAGAPLIEYSREALGIADRKVHGRIYWDTWFALYQGLHHDQHAFAKWYNHVVRWLRKNGKRVEITKGWSQYWFPGALEIEQLR
jgi:hypothetical protein